MAVFDDAEGYIAFTPFPHLLMVARAVFAGYARRYVVFASPIVG